MNSIIEPGHIFELLSLDGVLHQTITFVKRCDAEMPLRFPGNQDQHPGTTVQSVLRALHSRMCYLDSQHHCSENVEIMALIRRANWLLEIRAAKRHGIQYTLTEDEAIDAQMCDKCGHTICEHRNRICRG